MKKLVFIGVGIVVFVTLSVIGSLSAGQAGAQAECSLATVQGLYIFEAQGVYVDEDGSVLPYAEAGVWTLDGQGNAEGFISASTGGVPFARRDAFTATYEHTSDCVYSVVDAFGLEVDLFVVSGGEHIMYFSPGFSGTMVRQ